MSRLSGYSILEVLISSRLLILLLKSTTSPLTFGLFDQCINENVVYTLRCDNAFCAGFLVSWPSLLCVFQELKCLKMLYPCEEQSLLSEMANFGVRVRRQHFTSQKLSAVWR